MGQLIEELSNHKVLALDTSVIIYHFEANSKYLTQTMSILEGIQSGKWHGIISVQMLMEINVLPFRLGYITAAQNYEALLVNFPNLDIIDTNRHIVRKAAQLRAAHNVRPADAIHLATAIVGGATAWVCNDKSHRRLSEELQVFILDDYITEK